MKMLQKNLEKFLKHMKYYQIMKKGKNMIKKENRNFNEYKNTFSNFSFMPNDIRNMFNSRFNVENIDKINTKNAERYKKNIEKNFEDFFKTRKKQ